MSQAISILESAIGDPHQGLPEEIFLSVSRMTPLMNVDMLIQDDGGHTLLAWRDDELSGSSWHVPGGIIRYKEMVGDHIRACALGQLGAGMTFESAPALLHEAILEQRTEARSNRPARGEWRWHHSCPHDFLGAQAHYARFI